METKIVTFNVTESIINKFFYFYSFENFNIIEYFKFYILK